MSGDVSFTEVRNEEGIHSKHKYKHNIAYSLIHTRKLYCIVEIIHMYYQKDMHYKKKKKEHRPDLKFKIRKCVAHPLHVIVTNFLKLENKIS